MLYRYTIRDDGKTKNGSVTTNGTRDDAIQNIMANHPTGDAASITLQGDNKQASRKSLMKAS